MSNVLLLLFIAVSSAAVSGFVVTTDPASPIDISDVLIDSRAYKEITIRTDSDSEVSVDFSVQGKGMDWISVEPTSAMISRDKPAVLRLSLEPKNIPPGTYFGYLILTIFTGEAPTSAMAWSDSAQFSVQVTRDEIVSADLTDITVFDINAGDPFVIEGNVINKGNRRIEPIMTVDVLPQGGDTSLAKYQAQGAGIYGGEQSVIRINTPTDIPPGDYTARIELSADGLTFKRELVNFKVMSAGTQRGFMKDAYVKTFTDGANEKLNITGIFTNTGATQSRALLVAEIYRDGAAIARIKSDERLVISGVSENFSAVFAPLEGGDYTADVYFEYDNARTSEKMFQFELSEASPVNLGASMLILFTLLAASVMLLFWMRRGRRINEEKKKRDEELGISSVVKKR
jgi:hypothetical protein